MPNLWYGLRYNLFASHSTSSFQFKYMFLICRDFSRRFSLLCNCHPRYAHSSVPHWIWAAPSGYVASFLVAYAFLGAYGVYYRLGSGRFYVLESRCPEWTLTSSLLRKWTIQAVVGEMLLIDLTRFFFFFRTLRPHLFSIGHLIVPLPVA